MNVLSWLFCATLPCIIQAVFRPPIVVSMQPGGAPEAAPKTERVLCPVVYVSPTFRFRRSLDVVKRSIENEGFRFDPAVCDDNGQRLPVRGQVSLNGGPLQFGFGLRDDETQDFDAEVKSVLRPGSKPRKNLPQERSDATTISALVVLSTSRLLARIAKKKKTQIYMLTPGPP
ncbi:uncharacterized protein [Macrobrachium rosenbergii]|uniref:uncharacterized protein n=1 Tax=Macrobrachium rosenbergii TaxID=79674 RepID=UPI0034D42C48